MPTGDRFVVHLEHGRLSDTSRADVHRMVQAMTADPDGACLLVHVHGGLVNKAAGLATADRLGPFYRQAGACPLFFVWESGPVESIVNALHAIGRRSLFRALLRVTLAFARGKLAQSEGRRGAAPIPVDDGEIVRELADLAVGREPFADRSDRLPADAALTPGERAQFEAALLADAALTRANRAELWMPLRLVTGAVAVLVRCIRRYASGRAHGVYPTVVEEILREFYAADAIAVLWHVMKRGTERAFDAADEQAGGAALLCELASAWQAGYRPRIILVGHSTGAIFISHWLSRASEWLAPEVVFDVVHLASASTCGLMAQTIASSASRIRGFRHFGMDDERERADQLVPGLYTRSLLYFVSGVLEAEPDEPLVGMARFLGPPPRQTAGASGAVSAVSAFLAARPGGAVWAPSDGAPGRRSLAVRHGDFDDDAATLESLAHVIARGVE